MLFNIITTDDRQINEKLEFPSVEACCKYILSHASHYSNWSILRDDMVYVYVRYGSGEDDFGSVANVDLAHNSYCLTFFCDKFLPLALEYAKCSC